MSQNLTKHPVHLGLGATVVSEPEFTGEDWYEAYGNRHAADGEEGRLVSMHSFETPWSVWEVHPAGSELVLCTAGELIVIQELAGRHVRTRLGPGEYAINPPGVWHTADVNGPTTAVFITAGLGTQHRPR